MQTNLDQDSVAVAALGPTLGSNQTKQLPQKTPDQEQHPC